MNLQVQVEPLKNRASGFLATEACTPRGVADHFEKKHRLKRRSEPSRAKQDAKTILHRNSLLSSENRIDEALNICGPLQHSAFQAGALRPGAVEFICQVESGDDRDAQGVGTGQFLGRQTHFLIKIERQFGDIRRIKVAPDSVTLSLDLDGHEAASHE
jgi:hypothetical protein